MLPIATPLNALKPIATLATLALTRLDPGAICGLMVENPVTHQRAMGELAQDELLIQSTQGSNPGPMARVPQFLFTCAPSFLPITKRVTKKCSRGYWTRPCTNFCTNSTCFTLWISTKIRLVPHIFHTQ